VSIEKFKFFPMLKNKSMIRRLNQKASRSFQLHNGTW